MLSKSTNLRLICSLFIILIVINLWSSGGSNGTGGNSGQLQSNAEVNDNLFPAPDRIRNVPAVSSTVNGLSNDIYITSFGLKPYRESTTLEGVDAWVFRSQIQNGIFMWSFTNDEYFFFDNGFERMNSDLPDCGRNAYNVRDEIVMSRYFPSDEKNARIDGGTGFWTSPVLIENENALILLNKSGVLMCIDAYFSNNACVKWAYDLRSSEREIHENSAFHEFMATPTVADNLLLVPGIYSLFKIDISDIDHPIFNSATDKIRVIDNFSSGDHLINPVSYNLEEVGDINFLCVSRLGKFVIANDILNLQSNFQINNAIITSQPLVDSDGNVYIQSNNGIIYHYPQLLTNNTASLPSTSNDLYVIDCGNQTFNTTLITDFTQKLYTLTDENDILTLNESYNFSIDPPLYYSDNLGITEFELLYDDLYNNFKALNNHSIMLERADLGISCLTSIYNDNQIYTNEDYYTNEDPVSNYLILRMFGINHRDSGEVPSFYESIAHTSSYAGIAAYETFAGNNNLIWCDEKGYAWSWMNNMPSDKVDYPYESINPLISKNSNPKFMRNLTNVPNYNKTDITLNIYDWGTTNVDKIFLNSYCEDATFISDHYSATFTDILMHDNYTLGLRFVDGSSSEIKGLKISDQGLINVNFDTLYVTTGTSYIQNENAIYNRIEVSSGATLNIENSNIHVLESVVVENNGTLNVYDDSYLEVADSLICIPAGETSPASIKSYSGTHPSGLIQSRNLFIESNGNLIMEGAYEYEFVITNTTIDGNCELTSCYYDSPEIFHFNGDFIVNGSVDFQCNAKFQSGSLITLNQEASLNIENSLFSTMSYCTINVNSGAEFDLKINNTINHFFILENSQINIDNHGYYNSISKFNVTDTRLKLDNSSINVFDGAEFQLLSNVGHSEIELSNRSQVNIDGYYYNTVDQENKPSKFFLDWGTKIYGSTLSYNNPTLVMGDRIECTDGGIVTTDNDYSYHNHQDYPTVPQIEFTSTNYTNWDGIIINDPLPGMNYWLVNCDFQYLNKIGFEGDDNGISANLKLYDSDFHNSGEILVRDGHHLIIEGIDNSNKCNIYNNNLIPIQAYYSDVSMEYVCVGPNNSGGGLYLYGSSSNESSIDNCEIINNLGIGIKAKGPMISLSSTDVLSNSSIGVVNYTPTMYLETSINNKFMYNTGYEYAGLNETFFLEDMGNEFADSLWDVYQSDSILVMNFDWTALDDPISIDSNIFTYGSDTYTDPDVIDVIDQLSPHNALAWCNDNVTKQEKVLLNQAVSAIGNQNYASAEYLLEEVITDYPETLEASTALYYRFHLSSLVSEDYNLFMNYLDALAIIENSHLEKAKDELITKTYIKSSNYNDAIVRLEEVINTSSNEDEVIIAMIDEGYCYMKLSEEGTRSLPEKCTIKTSTFQDYQRVVSELEKGLSFLPKLETVEEDIPQRTTLSNNYPNPFNPTTKINFSIPVEQNVKLQVYNIKGQKVTELCNDFYPKGEHEVIWDGRDSNNRSVSSGVYFYKLDTDDKSITKKMLLLK